MGKKNFTLFFDMDDTIVDFGCDRHVDDVLTVIREEGFYENLGPLPFLDELNNIAAIFPDNVYIVSACVDTPYCIKEKIAWLKKYLPEAKKENVIFTKLGEIKSEKVEERIGRKMDIYDILVDDYSKNINEWEQAGGTGIKYKNKFNTKDPSKYKYVISNYTQLASVLRKINEDHSKR
ncbi:MAG: hypothetical protein MJ068_03790 [Clostridia bacterium]|nr:hypothetical protein [Clostridia bacterium]